MGHWINKCSCGTVLGQCRCMGDKVVTILEKGCDKCHLNNASVEYLPNSAAEWKITDASHRSIILSRDDWNYVNNIIYNFYFGED